MMNAAAHFAVRHAAPAAATGTLLALSLSPAAAEAKVEVAKTDVQAVKKSIADLIEDDMERRGDGTSLTGTFVRLAWHCAGTYSKVDGCGGSNGARMRFSPEASWGANAGLDLPRKLLESVKEKHPEIYRPISYVVTYILIGTYILLIITVAYNHIVQSIVSSSGFLLGIFIWREDPFISKTT